MKAAIIIMLSLVLACLSSQAKGNPNPMVVYMGHEAGLEGPRDFAYLVDMHEVGGEYPIMEFRVGAGDLDSNHYDNWLIPDGWQFGLGEDDPPFDVPLSCYSGCSDIGEVGTLLKHVSSRCVLFWTDDPKYAVWSFTFGFDYEGPAGDVGWSVEDERAATFTEDPFVGVGIYDDEIDVSGPMHGPTFIPEPTTLLLFLGGMIGVLSRRGKA